MDTKERYYRGLYVPPFVLRILGVLVFAGFSFSCNAMTLISTNLARLSELAESAFVIQIDSIVTTKTGDRPCDMVTGTVLDPVFGDVQTSQVISWNQFRLGVGIRLAGMPEYKVGSQYLIFLSGKGSGPGFQSPVGMGQGAFEVSRNPKTGAMAVRNAFANQTLSRGLDVQKAAEDMVTRDSRTRGISPSKRQKETDTLKAQMQGAPQNSLDTMKRAAQFFHDQKVQGKMPSRDYRTTETIPARH